METISKNRRIYRRNEPTTGCSNRKDRAEAVSSTVPTADGFLRHRFLPMWMPPNDAPPNKEMVEKDFYKSLSHMAKDLNFQPVDVKNKPYPVNILLSYWDSYDYLRNNDLSVELSIFQDDNGVFLSSKEVFDVTYTLFYIPVEPLYLLLAHPAERKTADLLLSVFCYLYYKAAIPYYRTEETSLFYQYDMLWECLQEEEDYLEKDEYQARRLELEQARGVGDFMLVQIENPCHLKLLKRRINNFRPASELQWRCLNLAKNTLHLMKNYPHSNVMSNMRHEEIEEDYYYDECVSPEEFISFVHRTSGHAMSDIQYYMGEAFGNTGNTDQPMICKTYQGKTQSSANLDYEIQLFQMLDELADTLKLIP